jgi:hypothetical protein
MEVAIGKVTHYYDHIGVAVMTLEDSLKLGDKIHIVGHSTDLIQRISSIQIEHHGVVWVKPGDNVAIRVIEPVHEHNVVYRIVEEIAEPVA